MSDISLRKNGLLKNGKWANRFKRCSICKTIKRPHRTKGMCGPCFNKWRFNEDREYFREFYKAYWKKNKKKLLKKMRKYYDDNRERLAVYHKNYMSKLKEK